MVERVKVESVVFVEKNMILLIKVELSLQYSQQDIQLGGYL
ncbi:hypothetical protein [Metabacillus iocasae]|uniref:Uncharacterized protein n=1 Tax=Priestia iocasae TaxID=2291674 RepID=A0ABS2QYC1_9BACI|nr:hypothetical protein [Metabacillus iocasae]MBM7704488.1 hypothetical protein [Metabacillus iocasae]